MAARICPGGPQIGSRLAPIKKAYLGLPEQVLEYSNPFRKAKTLTKGRWVEIRHKMEVVREPVLAV